MRLSTRLLVPLTSLLAIVMLLVGAWLVRAREQRLISESVSETRAYATALAIALENIRPADLDRIIERVSAEPGIYGLLLYDVEGRVLAAAAPVDPRSGMPASYVQTRLRDNQPPITLQRRIDGERFLSVLRPLRHGNVVDGAIEVLQPLAAMEAELTRTRLRFLWSALLIITAVGLGLIWMVRRIVAQPLQEFLSATRALGRGELNFRIPPTQSGAEIQELRVEFNNMADHLQAARERIVRETEERVALERQLRHTEKLAAAGNLAASVAHEIAAPLNVVAGRAEMLRRAQPAPDHHNRNLEIIGEQIARITLIVRNLLDYARGSELQLRAVAVCSVIDGVLEFLDGELARAGVAVEMDVPSALRVNADADRLHQVFLNLVLNSIQALDAVPPPRTIRIRGERDAEDVVIEITDNGPGMTEEIAAQVFEPFFTTKPRSAGTGLGLAVTRNIIDEHGGTIEAHTGSGGRFVIRLRAAEGDA